MTDTHPNLDPGVRGQTRSTWRDETHLRGVLLRLITENPEANREDLEALYLAKAEMVPALVEEALRRAFDNDWALLQKPKRAQRPPPSPEAKAAAAAKVTEQIKIIVRGDLEIVVEVEGKPTLKKLRDCTGPECRRAGGWLVAVADRVGDGIVGEKLSEAELAELDTRS